MKIVDSSYEILDTSLDYKKVIELAGRTCYKSENKITDTSAETFVNAMIKNGHGAMLEHGTIYLLIPYLGYLGSVGCKIAKKYERNKYSKVNNYEYKKFAITTNLRVLVENDWLKDLQYICEPTEHHEKRYSVRFTCDRGVSHELVRHRAFSFAQESTRYCNYSKDKHGNELIFIKPSRKGENYQYIGALTNTLKECENTYLTLIKQGWTAEEARAVLPNALKTEVVMTGYSSDWVHFFDLRSDTAKTGKPHPDVEKLATPLRREFESRQYI